MYKLYPRENGVDSVICFTDEIDLDETFAFRDKIWEPVSRKGGYVIHTDTSTVIPRDSEFVIFENEENAQKLQSLESPGCIACIFKTTSWKKFNKEFQQLRKSILFEMVTSHDFPCIVITNSICSIDELECSIIKAARQLNIKIHKNEDLPALDKYFLLSNRTFDIDADEKL